MESNGILSRHGFGLIPRKQKSFPQIAWCRYHRTAQTSQDRATYGGGVMYASPKPEEPTRGRSIRPPSGLRSSRATALEA